VAEAEVARAAVAAMPAATGGGGDQMEFQNLSRSDSYRTLELRRKAEQCRRTRRAFPK